MADENGTVVETDVVELGFYGQILTVGGYVGWNDNGKVVSQSFQFRGGAEYDSIVSDLMKGS